MVIFTSLKLEKMDVSKEEQSVKNMSKLTTALPQTDGMQVYTNSEPPVGVP